MRLIAIASAAEIAFIGGKGVTATGIGGRNSCAVVVRLSVAFERAAGITTVRSAKELVQFGVEIAFADGVGPPLSGIIGINAYVAAVVPPHVTFRGADVYTGYIRAAGLQFCRLSEAICHLRDKSI